MQSPESNSGTLYLVPTPIGNLEDVSPRVKRLLEEVDLVAAEDTRTARKLFKMLAISPKRLCSYFQGNEAERSVEFVERLLAGESIALISEAGTPAVSDPGERLVAQVAKSELPIVSVPGPCAAISALVASGLPTQRFSFFGFLPKTKGARQAELGKLRTREETLVFYESPERLSATLLDMVGAFGADRQVSLGREMSKLFEEHVRGSCSALAQRYREVAPRGECTLVVSGAVGELEEFVLDDAVRELLSSGLGPKDVAARLVVKSGKPRREIYQLALSLKRDLE